MIGSPGTAGRARGKSAAEPERGTVNHMFTDGYEFLWIGRNLVDSCGRSLIGGVGFISRPHDGHTGPAERKQGVRRRERGVRVTARRRFGECLARVVPLSALDIAEILEDQAASRRRFGEIALAWGLCEPHDVWEAWANQLAHFTPVVNLDALGIDAQATAELPARLARRYRALPMRKIGGALVVAVEETTAARAAAKLPALLGMTLRFVVARGGQIESALRTYYPDAAPGPTPGTTRSD
jgi:hypothetical protein